MNLYLIGAEYNSEANDGSYFLDESKLVTEDELKTLVAERGEIFRVRYHVKLPGECAEVVNLTKSEVVLIGEDGNVLVKYAASENPAYVETNKEEFPPIRAIGGNIPVIRMVTGEIRNLPDPCDDTVYIVSSRVAQACPERDDLFITNGVVRDEFGQVIGYRSLAHV